MRVHFEIRGSLEAPDQLGAVLGIPYQVWSSLSFKKFVAPTLAGVALCAGREARTAGPETSGHAIIRSGRREEIGPG